MLPVNSPNQFSETDFIAYFSGKTYVEAVRLAGEWSQRTGATLLSYYEQKAFGKSILVSYKKEDKDD